MSDVAGARVNRVSTGIGGLDEILGGGLPRNRLYLYQGEPGTGKTTAALQFLIEGARHGERGLYVTLSETKDELIAVAGSHGWDLNNIDIFEVRASEDHLKAEEQYTAFHPSEVELGETVRTLLDEVERLRPKRVVVDSLSEMRLLARDPLRYRRQILALKQFLLSRGATVLLLDDPAPRVGEHQFQTLAHGVILLEKFSPEYGRERRRLQIVKMRSVAFPGGFHDFAIQTGGLVVHPRLVSADHQNGHKLTKVSSGVSEIDALLDGGPERGTTMLIMGASGTGKSTLALQYAQAATVRGEPVALYSFDERLQTLFARAGALGMNLHRQIDSGLLSVAQVDPAMLSPGEFIHHVREAVEQKGARLVIIDSLNGYLNAMPGERFLVIQMHELLSYLANKGVLTIVVVAQHGLTASWTDAPVDLSYLSDTVIVLRYFEFGGEVRKALAVVKKRTGSHELTIREVKMNARGLNVGEPLRDFQGVLSGSPNYSGPGRPLLREDSRRGR